MSQQYQVEIKDTTDKQIAIALAHLAGFNEETAFGRASYGLHPQASHTAIVFHEDTIAKDPDMFMAVCNPDIAVSEILGDKYVIEFGKRAGLNSSLVGKIEEEIDRINSESRGPILNLLFRLKKKLAPARS